MKLLTQSVGSLFVGLLVLLPVAQLHAQSPAPSSTQSRNSGLPLPRFVSLRANEVNMRTGPGVRYPVDWVYQRQRMPVEVINELGTWRKVRDSRGTQGWIHQSMLSNRRSLLIMGQMRTIRSQPDSKSAAVARAEPGVVGEILACPDGVGWCRVKIEGFEGWLRRVEFWGAHAGETIQ